MLPYNYKGENYVIGTEAFRNKTSITRIEIPNSVTSIGEGAFYGCSGLTSIVIPNSVTSIGEGVFYGCSGFTSIVIPNSVTSIGEGVFYGCSGLTSIVIPNSVTSIGNSAFYGCSGLTSIEIPVGVESIGAAAFKNCAALAYISIPNSVKDIANDAFDGCTALKKVELNTATVGGWFSGNTTLKEVVTGNSVTSIVGSAFSGCTNLASLTIGSKVTSIGTDAFNACNNVIKVFWLGNTPPAGYEQLSGKINYVANNQYAELTGETVVSQFLSSRFEIGGTVFIPTSLADRTCCVVDYDILSDVSDVVIEESVSYQGVSLKVQDVKPYSFYAKENLETVTFAHDGGIGTSAFEGCDSLENVEIPHTVTFVGDHAFRNCTNLVDVKISDRETVLSLGMQLFVGTSLETLYIGGKISYEENGGAISPFSGSSTLKSVVITNAESNIYDYEFYNCTALESAVVGDGVEKIGRWAFSGCLNLTDFVFGSNLEEIGEEAFSDCTGLVQITGRAVLPPVCGDQALDDINKWTCKLYVPTVNLEAYKSAPQWKEFMFVEELVTTDNYVTYKIDGEVYKTLLIKPGERIIVPTVAEREYCAFSGWDLDEYISAEGYPVMPDEDIVVEGSFIADKFVITYIVDGAVFVTESVAYGDEVVLIDEPVREGYTFSGWSEVSETMLAEDITVTGSFAVNYYTVTYKVDGEVYATDSVSYGEEIVLIEAPVKEGYTFSGWSEVPATMPAEDITVTGSFAVNYYAVTYIVDGEEYETMTVEYGKEITLPATPEKEGHTFSGWSEVPETMPAEDITVEGSFAVNYYTVTYKVDGEVYATDSVSYGSEIVLIEEPTKEGYTFSGWSEIPATMPAEDITVEGSFAVNYYTVTYMVDGEVYATDSVAYGDEVVLIDEPVREGYTFSGWSEVPATMPAEDITVEGSFTKIETSIDQVLIDSGEVVIYDLNGLRIVDVHELKRGVYIVNGKKLFVK